MIGRTWLTKRIEAGQAHNHDKMPKRIGRDRAESKVIKFYIQYNYLHVIWNQAIQCGKLDPIWASTLPA